jgi:exopolysaccharide production protein ExoQ
MATEPSRRDGAGPSSGVALPGLSLAEDAARRAKRERWLLWLLIGLSFVCSLVPDTLSMSAVGPAADHTITGGSALRQVEFGSIYVVCAWLVWRHPQDAWVRVRALNPFLFALLLYCCTTALWSPFPALTLKRGAMFAGMMLIGFALSPPFSAPRAIFRATLGALTVLLVISFFVALLVPQVGVDYLLGGAWRGIMWQKNMLGSVAAVASLFWLRERSMPDTDVRTATAGLLFSLFMLVMAKSATAKLITGISFLIYLATRRKLTNGRTGSILLLAAALIVMYALLIFFVAADRLPNVDDLRILVTGLFNKSSDLTGRDQIWALVWESIWKHPLLGFGYGAFWTGEGGPAEYIEQALGWMPPHAHNGYLDVLNELGEVGLGLFLGTLAWHAASLIRLYFIDSEDAAMHMALFVSILVSNFSETQLLADTAFQNLIFLYSAMSVSARLAVHKQASKAARETAVAGIAS